jgi:hypothetical protein
MIGAGKLSGNGKIMKTSVQLMRGCDIGYAPASGSCERAYSVDICTVAALDVITAFAVPNPNCSSQKQSVFSGLVPLQVALMNRSLSLVRTDKFYFANPFKRPRPAAVRGHRTDHFYFLELRLAFARLFAPSRCFCNVGSVWLA